MALLYLLLLTVYILPFFYDYLGAFPSWVKWLNDILLFAATLATVMKFRRESLKHNTILKLVLFTFIALAVIAILSAIQNQSDFILGLLVFRKIVQPLFVFLIFYYFFLEGKNSEKLHRFFKHIIILQILILPIQYMCYRFLPNYENLLVPHVTFNEYDIACGTFGNGATSAIGVFSVMYFVCAQVIYRVRFSYIYLLPLLFIFSGGANILLLIALVFILSFDRSNILRRVGSILLGLLLIVGVSSIVSSVLFDQNLLDQSVEYIETHLIGYSNILQYNDTYEWVSSEGRVHRVKGLLFAPTFLESTGSTMLGLGPDLTATSTTLGIQRNNSLGISEVNNEVLLFFLEGGFSALIVYVAFGLCLTIFLFRNRRRGDLFRGGFIISLVFFLGGFYTLPLRNQPVMFFLMFIFALLSYHLQQEKISPSAKS